jgi:hypothetical protein
MLRCLGRVLLPLCGAVLALAWGWFILVLVFVMEEW